MARAEGRYHDALTQVRLSDYGICEVCALPALGRTYELRNEPDSAASICEPYVTTPERWRAYWDIAPLEVSYPLPGIYERLGDLYEQRGDTVKAIYYYGEFAELWKDAEPELQPRVEAARGAIEALSPDR